MSSRGTSFLRISSGALGLVASLLTPLTAAADLVVAGDQRVTIVGDYASLEQLVEELSWEAGFELRSFGLADRAVSVSMTDVTLGDALRRLVGRDVYTVGLTVGESGAARVTWVEIPGPREPMGARKGGPKPRAPGEALFQVPPKLFLEAFENTDPSARSEALATISKRVLEDPVERERFLATDVAMFVGALEKYPDAPETLRTLARPDMDAALDAKLEEVIAALERRQREKRQTVQ